MFAVNRTSIPVQCKTPTPRTHYPLLPVLQCRGFLGEMGIVQQCL